MSKKANPTLVGAFLVGAVFLVVAGILILGSGSFLKPEVQYVAHFESAVTGLEVGAPVRYQGVQIGRVSRITAVWSENEEEILIPVELTFTRGAIQTPSEQVRQELERRGTVAVMNSLVDRGLRAVLIQDSFVTGKLHVALQFHPDTEAHLVGGSELKEIPTLTVGLERMTRTIADLPIEDLVQGAIDLMSSIETLTKNPRIRDVLDKLDAFISHADEQVGPVATSIQGLVEDLRQVSTDVSHLTQNIDGQIGPLSGEATGALKDARGTMASFNTLLGEDQVLLYRLVTMLEEMSEAARALRVLADAIERHPESILSGRGNR